MKRNQNSLSLRTLIISLILILAASQPALASDGATISTSISRSFLEQIPVLQQGYINSAWNTDICFRGCDPFVENFGNFKKRYFRVTTPTFMAIGLDPEGVVKTSSEFTYYVSRLNTVTEGDNFLEFEVDYKCSNNQTLGIIELDIKTEDETHKIKYLVDCGAAKAIVSTTNYSAWVIVILASIFVFAITRITKPLRIEDEDQAGDLREEHAILFFVGASITLLMIYFFDWLMTYLLTAMVTISSFSAICIIFYLVFERFFPKWYSEGDCFAGVSVSDIVSIPTSLLIVAGWFFTRHYLLNNLIAVSLAYLAIRMINVSRFYIVLIFLGLMFVFDIFWVFGSAKIISSAKGEGHFSHGEFHLESSTVSVMEKAATAIDIPIKIIIPNALTLIAKPLDFSLLGLGDIIIPSIALKFFKKFDERVRSIGLHGISSFGYFIGMIAAQVGVQLMETGQPALMYLVPIILGLATLKALIKGDLEKLWQYSDEEYERVNGRDGPNGWNQMVEEAQVDSEALGDSLVL